MNLDKLWVWLFIIGLLVGVSGIIFLLLSFVHHYSVLLRILFACMIPIGAYSYYLGYIIGSKEEDE